MNIYNELSSDMQLQNTITKHFENENFSMNIVYCVKAGICYVSLLNVVITTLANERTQIAEDMPIPQINSYGCIIGDSSGDDLGLVFIDSSTSVLTFMPRKNTGIGFGTFSYPIQKLQT